MRSRDLVLDSLLLLGLTYLLLSQIQAIWPFTIDDMYISLRYAKHLAGGEGLLWNVNALPVEGYSNFSFVVLAALAISLKLDPVVVLKAIGVVGLICTVFSLYWISRFWLDKRQALFPCFTVLLYKGQLIWAVSGLETTLYEAFLCAALYCLFRGLGYRLYPHTRGKAKIASFVLSGLLFALAGMTRPETPLLILVFILLSCWDRPTTNKALYNKGIFLFVVTLGLVFLPYFIWRWQYYGLLFPNPVYCKAFESKSHFQIVLSYLQLAWPFALLALVACLDRIDKRYYFLWLPSLLYSFMLWSADPVVAFDNRLFLPAFVLLLPLAYQGLCCLIAYFTKIRTRAYYLSFYVSAVFLNLLFVPWLTPTQYRHFSENPQEGQLLRTHVIQWLNSHSKSGDTVVLADSGMIPYGSSLSFIDSYCLNNRAMAQYPAEQRYLYFCEQILKAPQPQIIILTSLEQNRQIIYTPSDSCLKTALSNHSNYRLMKTYSSKTKDSIYRYEIYAHTQ